MTEQRVRAGGLAMTLGSDGVAVLRLDRAKRRNALTLALLRDLREEFDTLAADTRCRAIVLCGEGPSFCAGMDVSSPLVGDSGDRVAGSYAAMRLGTSVILAMREAPQPVIAAVHGHAIGAGFALAAACDLRVCTPDAIFGAPFLRLGLSAGDLGLTWLLPRLIGAARAAELLYTNGSLDAEEAVGLGFCSIGRDDALQSALALAGTIAAQPPLAVQMTKELLNASLGAGGFREHLALEMRSQVIALNTADHAATVRRLLERGTSTG